MRKITPQKVGGKMVKQTKEYHLVFS